jgi:hypothetical protein
VFVKQKQSGFALLLFMVVVIGYIIAGYSAGLTTSVQQVNEQKRLKNTKVLLEAKEALLSYALNYAVTGEINKMGKLPCPDHQIANSEGTQDSPCGGMGINAVGYFPYKTIGKGKIEDASGECLWYVVSGDYKNEAESKLLNWDSVGYLNLVDENGTLQHENNEDNFPVAFIISPGISIDQDRLPDGSLADCGGGNHTMASYLEGGSNIDYSTDLPASADTLWTFLTASAAASSSNVNYNDQVIAVYRDELWDRVAQIGQLNTDNNSPVDTLAETVTQQLANCLQVYGNHINNTDRTLPFAAPIDLTDYRSSSNYDDTASLLAGRFPQNINNSEAPGDGALNDIISNDTEFVFDGSSTGYCGTTGLAANEMFWKNWKDHFFYVVGDDFKPNSSPPALANRCDDNEKCITVDLNNNLAAVIFFAGEADAAQIRDWTPAIDNKNNIMSYLNGANTAFYDGSAVVDYSSFQDDFAYCVLFDDAQPSGSEFSILKCRDIP